MSQWLNLIHPSSLSDEAQIRMTDGHGLDASVLVGLALILAVAKLGGELFERWGQPAVLGELAGGILVGNLALAGFTGAEFLRDSGAGGAGRHHPALRGRAGDEPRRDAGGRLVVAAGGDAGRRGAVPVGLG